MTPSLIKQSATDYLKENLFVKNQTDLDVMTFNYSDLPYRLSMDHL
jgi:hypothetical protein